MHSQNELYWSQMKLVLHNHKALHYHPVYHNIFKLRWDELAGQYYAVSGKSDFTSSLKYTIEFYALLHSNVTVLAASAISSVITNDLTKKK